MQLSTFCPEMDYIIFTIWLIYLSSKGKLKENYFLCVFLRVGVGVGVNMFKNFWMQIHN